jgi:hypothetical protein
MNWITALNIRPTALLVECMHAILNRRGFYCIAGQLDTRQQIKAAGMTTNKRRSPTEGHSKAAARQRQHRKDSYDSL